MATDVRLDNHGLRPRELKAISALLEEPTIERAAESAGISARTLRRYLTRPSFRAAYEEARRAALGGALSRLQEAAGVAVRVLMEIVADDDARHADRIRASVSILDHAIRGRELLGLEERIKTLEVHSERWENTR